MLRPAKVWIPKPAALVMGAAAVLLAGFVDPPNVKTNVNEAVLAALQKVKERFAPDPHLAIFDVKPKEEEGAIVLRGETGEAAARDAAVNAVKQNGFTVRDEIEILPQGKLKDTGWGIATISLVNLREKPGNPSEMGTQAFMGSVLRVWKTQTNWYLVQTADKYLGWTEGGAFVPCAREMAEAWQAAPLLIVTALDERILEQPSTNAPQISDVVQCDLVKRAGEEKDWYQVELPDGRKGFLPKAAAADYAQWKSERKPTPENIERTAKSLIGRPYFWGCNSVRGLDCSGFTKLVFYLNGIDLNRNAAQQCLQGVEVPLDDNYKQLKKGDLLFFGRPDRRTGVERITHVAIYLQDKLFIQSATFVHVSSLNPDSPLAEPRRIRTLLHARRVIPNP